MIRNVPIGRYFGIPIKIHWSFGILIAFLVYLFISKSLSSEEIYILIIGLISIFTFVLLHELGHAYAARKVNVSVNDILLTPIGGLARLESIIYKNPYKELVIATGGPIINLLLALLFLLGAYLSGNKIPDINSIISFNTNEGLFLLFYKINIILFAFNLLPAFPMDGGRIFRAVLRIRYGREKATYVAKRLARIIAISFIFLAIKFHFYIIILIAIIVFLMAENELEAESQTRVP